MSDFGGFDGYDDEEDEYGPFPEYLTPALPPEEPDPYEQITIVGQSEFGFMTITQSYENWYTDFLEMGSQAFYDRYGITIHDAIASMVERGIPFDREAFEEEYDALTA